MRTLLLLAVIGLVSAPLQANAAGSKKPGVSSSTEQTETTVSKKRKRAPKVEYMRAVPSR